MKVDNLEKQLLSIGFLAQDSLSGVAALVKEVFTKTRVYGDEEDKISYWQLIFLQSKANGCSYRAKDLPHMKWQWPRDTWFQERLSHHHKALEFPTQRRGNCNGVLPTKSLEPADIERSLDHDSIVGTTRPRISLFMQRFHNLGLIETNKDLLFHHQRKETHRLPRSDRLERLPVS